MPAWAASFINSSFEIFKAGQISETLNTPDVRVPVLSKNNCINL